uniref:Uncharacterized protein n=1 Tax=Spermophilus dauricus TaxID=99837 RepID=A0A8C9QP48_SPEDA
MPESNFTEWSDISAVQVAAGYPIYSLFSCPQDVEFVFGVLGIPLASQELDIRYVGMRNYQVVRTQRWWHFTVSYRNPSIWQKSTLTQKKLTILFIYQSFPA